MSSRLAVVISPKSRQFRHDPGAIDRIRAVAGPETLVAVCSDTVSTTAAMAEAHARGVKLVAVAGGDGTAGHVIGRIRETWGEAPWPALGLIRGGTMNTVANGLGLSRGRPEALLKRLVSVLSASEATGRPFSTIHRPTLDVGGRVGFLFGTGVFHNFLDAYYTKGHGDPTVLTAAETISHTVASILTRGDFARRLTGPVAMTVEVDGEVWPERRFLGVNAGTVREVGLGFRAFHLAHDFRDAFHLMGLTGSPSDVVVDLPRVWLGLGVRGRNGRNVVARQARLTPADGQALAYMVDGDLFTTSGPLDIRTGPEVAIARF